MKKENRIAFTDTIEFNGPLTLSIGDRNLTINPPALLLHKRIHSCNPNDDYTGLEFISSDPLRHKVRIVVDGKLLASAMTGISGVAGKLVKHDDGSLQLSLTERYTRLNRHHSALSCS